MIKKVRNQLASFLLGPLKSLYPLNELQADIYQYYYQFDI